MRVGRGGRRGRGGGVLVPVLLVALCFLGFYLLTHPDLLPIPATGVMPSPGEQTPVTTASPLYDEIHARYGNKYDGYEGLVRRTASGGFDTREADAAMAGQTLTTATGTPPPVGIPPRTLPVSMVTATGEIESYIVQYTNDERRAQGVPALQPDTCLQEIARAHSVDMAAKGYFSHDNRQGQDPSARAGGHGCPVWKPVGSGTTLIGIGENIGKMPTGNVMGHGYVSDNPHSVARAQVDSWMGSAGHRANILNPAYSSIGVGTSRDSQGYYISTQDFL
jgi:uncharacterized protein YkwD